MITASRYADGLSALDREIRVAARCAGIDPRNRAALAGLMASKAGAAGTIEDRARFRLRGLVVLRQELVAAFRRMQGARDERLRGRVPADDDNARAAYTRR